VSTEDEGNPTDTAAPDSSRRPEPPPPPLEEPPDPRDDKSHERLSRQVPIGLGAAVAAVMVFLAIVATIAYFALSPKR
jgi:hypothetical protein